MFIFYIDVMQCQMTLMVQEVTAAHMKKLIFLLRISTLVFFGMIMGYSMTLWFVVIYFLLELNLNIFKLALHSWISTCRHT